MRRYWTMRACPNHVVHVSSCSGEEGKLTSNTSAGSACCCNAVYVGHSTLLLEGTLLNTSGHFLVTRRHYWEGICLQRDGRNLAVNEGMITGAAIAA